MAFSGKATYSAGATLPEVAEDVSDLVAINSPFETPLLEALGDASRPARSTVHEWLEDELLPNSDEISVVGSNPTTDTTFTVEHASRFRVGDQVRAADSGEVMLVTGVNTGTGVLTVTRGYGGSTAEALAVGAITILGNAALEGDDAQSPRFTSRVRASNYTQIFAAGVEVSGSELAVRQIGVTDELDYQKPEKKPPTRKPRRNPRKTGLPRPRPYRLAPLQAPDRGKARRTKDKGSGGRSAVPGVE